MSVQPNSVLSHYRLLEKIGEGGMGVVWKAEDTVLGRAVAIKVLPADLALDEARRRMFLAEARLASSVSDARIVQVHELGREGDLDFIVMEYVDGKPLSSILHGRPLPPDKVAALGEQVARALSRAHRKGLLHRDLKPANILVTADGDVKVVDFGLATLFTGPLSTRGPDASTQSLAAGPGGEAGRTGIPRPAGIAGTLPYMSPEQVRGETLDARSDIFSLAVVLYEMTTGQRPFAGPAHAELMREIQKARPRAPHELVAKLPLDLDRIIQKGLAPQRGDRYQTMEDLAVDLKRLGRDLESGSSPSHEDLKQAGAPVLRRRRVLWVVSVGLLIAALGVGLWLRGSWRGTRADERTILILPMEVRGQSEGAEYAGRAFAEAIAMNLARAKNLTVLPVPERGGAGLGQGPSPVVAALDVRAGRLVTGAVVRDAKGLHASVSLLDSERNRIVWGAQKSAEADDLAGLAASLARELSAELGAVSQKLYDYPLYSPGTPQMMASPDFSAALAAIRRMDYARSPAATQRLVDSFPDEPAAWVLHLYPLFFSAWESAPSSPQRQAFDSGAATLARLDPNNPWGDFCEALLLTAYGRPRESAESFTRILSRTDLTPAARGYILSFRGQDYAHLGETDSALADIEEALRLDPANDISFAVASHILYRMDRFEESLTRIRIAMAINPESYQNNWGLGRALYVLGRWEEAVPALKKACGINATQWVCAFHALALLRAGHTVEANTVVQIADALPEDSSGAYMLACFHAVSGDRAAAIRLLRRAYELDTSDDDYEGLMKEPDLVSLHGDPEFEKIAAGVKERESR